MKIKFYILISLFIVSCGGGGGMGDSSSDNNGGTGMPSDPMINTFASTASSVSINTSVTLSWTTSNTNSCSASGDWSGTKSLNGSEDITLDKAKTYSFTLTCSGASGTSNATSNITVEVSSVDGSDIYSEDKASYCKDPINNSSSYWIENFDSNIFDEDIFTYQLGNGFNASDGSWVGGWGNNELQYYTGPGEGYAKNYDSITNTTENLFIEDGYLKIQPIYNTSNVFQDPYCADGSCSYEWPHTSARVITSSKKIFEKPSRITICFKVPDGTGHWPAVWMLPQGFIEGTKTWPTDGEIDLMEARGRVASEIGATLHFGNSMSRVMINKAETVPNSVNFHDKFHSVTFEWQENSIKVYLDTQETPFYEESSDSTEFNSNYYPFNESFYLLLNVASGGDYDTFGVVTNMYCHDEECSNLADPDRGRLIIDYIEYKSID
ncbi:glycoside hydrolase family 16 protein [Gammaproteobacteria bacterium]|nr:glycoside hydrolase family 16 protein [Gammaproteobacteria bacterium]